MIVGHGGGGCGHLGGNFLMWWSSSYSAHGDCRVRCAHGLGGDRGRFGGHCMGVMVMEQNMSTSVTSWREFAPCVIRLYFPSYHPAMRD